MQGCCHRFYAPILLLSHNNEDTVG
ncbi:hypothetical protein L195_g038960, partial [Trifolium pratense]